MPRSSADPPKTAGQVNVYWRRRVIALAAGLGMLALVTWTVNGALGGGPTRQATDLSQTTRQHSAQHSSPPASATPGSTAGATPSSTATPTPSPSSSAKRHPAGKRGRKTSAPGCRAPHRAVRPGTYTATAYSGKLSSRSMTFVLKGP
jgi:hypothetical protein